MNIKDNPFFIGTVVAMIQKYLGIEEATNNMVLRDCDDVTDADIRHCIALISCHLKIRIDINPSKYKTVGDIIKAIKESA